jgi:hypothetical protein
MILEFPSNLPSDAPNLRILCDTSSTAVLDILYFCFQDTLMSGNRQKEATFANSTLSAGGREDLLLKLRPSIDIFTLSALEECKTEGAPLALMSCRYPPFQCLHNRLSGSSASLLAAVCLPRTRQRRSWSRGPATPRLPKISTPTISS